jgi:hypothetical protein
MDWGKAADHGKIHEHKVEASQSADLGSTLTGLQEQGSLGGGEKSTWVFPSLEIYLTYI